jgi:DNA processing protein
MENTLVNKIKPTDFPPWLKEIPDPPKELFYRGVLPKWENYKCLTVVGARKFTSYGKEACEKLISGLAGYPIIIISGLALGIDTIAHRAAMAAGLKTIAVPGSGLADEIIYPASHLGFAREIIRSGGALLSEFPPTQRAAAWTFPKRNRIMAGLSQATLVVEAEKKSGTLITARLAAEYNRDVLTIPGSIFSLNSEGPHLLLKLGATPINQSADILEALGFRSPETPTNQVSSKIDSYQSCSPAEIKILKLLTEPLSRDEIIRLAGGTVAEVNALLTMLEIKGLIKESMGEIHLI